MSANEKQVGGEHYILPIQPWNFITENFGTEFLRGNILKYACRIGLKGDKEAWIQDLKKIIHYCEKWIDVIEHL